MVILVNVARFELKLHKPVKRVLAFILSDLIGRKGVSVYFALYRCSICFELKERGVLVYPALHMCSLIFILLFTSLLRVAFSFLSLCVTKREMVLDMVVLAGSRG